MKATIMKSFKDNSGLINITDQSIEIKKGRFIKGDVSHPLFDSSNRYFKRVYCLENSKKNIIYFFNTFGKEASNNGFHVGFTKLENQRFLFLQGIHWFQKEENIRYIINVLFLIIGTFVAFLGLSNNE